MPQLVDDHLYRQKQILGDPKAIPPVEPIIPVSPSTWWKGIKDGIFPKGKKLSPRVRVWTGLELRSVIKSSGDDK